MFELFGRYKFKVILNTKDNQNFSKQVKQQDEQCDREEQIQVASKIGFVNAEVFRLDDKADSWARVPSKASIGRVSVFALNFNRASNPPPIVLEQMTAPIALRIQETTIYVLKCSSGWIKVGSGSNSSPIWMSRQQVPDTETARTEQPSGQRGQAVLF